MNIKKIDHVAINVQDLNKSIMFYRDILGFELLETIECDGFSISYLMTPDGSRMELFDYRGSSPEHIRPENEIGLRHLAFYVEDVASHEKELRNKGVEITLSACDLENLNSRVLLFLDPNGVTLEFCERL